MSIPIAAAVIGLILVALFILNAGIGASTTEEGPAGCGCLIGSIAVAIALIFYAGVVYTKGAW